MKWTVVQSTKNPRHCCFTVELCTFCILLISSIFSVTKSWNVTADYKIVMLVNRCLLWGLEPRISVSSAVHLTGRRHLRSAASGKLYVQRTATAIGRRNCAVSDPDTWNSLPAELRLSTLSMATFARRLKAHLFVSTEWHVAVAHLISLKAALL